MAPPCLESSRSFLLWLGETLIWCLCLTYKCGALQNKPHSGEKKVELRTETDTVVAISSASTFVSHSDLIWKNRGLPALFVNTPQLNYVEEDERWCVIYSDVLLQPLFFKGMCHDTLMSPAPVCSACKQLCLTISYRWHEAFSAGATCRSNTVLTVGLCADEAGGGAVKEGKEAGHGQTDVRVGRPEVESGEAGEVNLQDVLWSHLNIGHLHRDTQISLFGARVSDFDVFLKHFILFQSETKHHKKGWACLGDAELTWGNCWVDWNICNITFFFLIFNFAPFISIQVQHLQIIMQLMFTLVLPLKQVAENW